jgi:putative spermidine/putrescine transport system ATP-binding protein
VKGEDGITGVEVRLEGIGKRYGSVVAVENLTLEVGAGSFLTLLGPSGCGKTTTLMMIAGFVAPTVGQVFIGGECVTSVPPYERNLGVVFQNYALFPHMTVFDNVAFPLRMRRTSRRETAAQVDKSLRLVRLEGMEWRYPRQLSGGQQQRVALARALVFEPPVLLMDEPLGALDKNLRVEMRLELKQLQQRLGITVISVTHDQEEALATSDLVAVLDHGRLLQVGVPSVLYEQPLTPFVAQFLGESNLLQGVLTSTAFVSDGGLRVLVGPSEGLPAGTRVKLVIRPERILLARKEVLAINWYEAVVEDVTYLGDARSYRVRVGQDSLTVKQANMEHSIVLRRGDPVVVGWDPRHSLVFEASSH